MTAVRIQVTAEDIAACAIEPGVAEGFKSTHPEGKDPVELAIARVAGVETMCDEDRPGQEMATIGQGANTLVANLPPEVSPWIDRYYKGQAVEPFDFDIEIEDWLHAFLATPADMVTLAEASRALKTISANSLRTAARNQRDGLASETALAGRLGMVRIGRDWFIPRHRLLAEVARRDAAS